MTRHQIEIDDEKSVYSQGLAVVLTATRTDRPSEWQMDEYADMARDLEQEVERLKGAIEECLKLPPERGDEIPHILRLIRG